MIIWILYGKEKYEGLLQVVFSTSIYAKKVSE